MLVDFDLRFENHADAILSTDFPDGLTEVVTCLEQFRVPILELIQGGGGEGPGTQRLRKCLAASGWSKKNIKIETKIDGTISESQSHEIDHVKAFNFGSNTKRTLALEIEWNNKDPFFDRDLESFRRLHSNGAISVGIIVTRGQGLNESIPKFIAEEVDRRGIHSVQNLLDEDELEYAPTKRQRELLEKRISLHSARESFGQSFSHVFVADKFGKATTHWEKLIDRIDRGVANPCPIVCIGLPESAIER